jgi:hypothetical protein
MWPLIALNPRQRRRFKETATGIGARQWVQAVPGQRHRAEMTIYLIENTKK